MIKAILFDLDGVLIDADKWHFNALNLALQYSDIDPISWQEHLTIYKGIPTRAKLGILTERRGLDPKLWDQIAAEKQRTTEDIIERFCALDPEKIQMLKLLKRKYKIGVCSNSIRKSVDHMLRKSGLAQFVDFSLSNEDVKNSKPNPEIYYAAFKKLGLLPDECVIVEDSEAGKQAAKASGGVLCPVMGPNEVNYYRVLATINEYTQANIVIPAAGQGKRFSEVGYQHPKPLIDVKGTPMIDLVLGNFRGIGKPIVIMQKRHVEQYCADKIIQHLEPKAEITCVDGLTEGAACTVLSAERHFNNNSELIIANSDQYLDFNIKQFIEKMRTQKADGGILTFKANHPKWSYAKVGADGFVSEVAEKVVISDQATVGIYYFRHGSDFVTAAKSMIQKNIRVNNEFYVCPVFNELIQMGKKIITYEIDAKQMHGLGTPEDLDIFLASRPKTEILIVNETVEEARFSDALTETKKETAVTVS